MGVRRVRNEVSVEVERALLGMSVCICLIMPFFPFEMEPHMRYRIMTDV
jgi:hypothetical protein